MKIVVLADVHSHQYSQFATVLPSGRNSRLQNVVDVLGEVAAFCRKNRVEALFLLGDLFHSRTKLDVDVLSATWVAVRDLCDAVQFPFFLVGNHDCADKSGQVHSLEPFRELGTVIDVPVIERVHDLEFAAHPFTHDIESWQKFTKLIPKVDFFFGHQGVNEAAIGAYDISVKAEVSYADLPLDKARFCVFGHYHKHQMLGEDRRFIYTGSPLQHNFGERTEKKGFIYFEDHEQRPQFVEAESAPRFLLLEGREAFEKELHDDNCFAGWHYIRFQTCVQEDADWVAKHFPRVQIEIIQAGDYEEHRIDEKAAQSDQELVRTYVERQPHNLDDSRLVSMGMELLGEE